MKHALFPPPQALLAVLSALSEEEGAALEPPEVRLVVEGFFGACLFSRKWRLG